MEERGQHVVHECAARVPVVSVLRAAGWEPKRSRPSRVVSGPLARTTAMAAVPVGVASAAMVSVKQGIFRTTTLRGHPW